MSDPSIPPILRVGPEAVLLTGPKGIGTLRYAVLTTINHRRIHGLGTSGNLQALLQAVSHAGQEDAPKHADDQDEPIDWISSREAATMLGVSNRQARRLAPKLGGQLIAGRYALDAAAVQDHLEGKKIA